MVPHRYSGLIAGLFALVLITGLPASAQEATESPTTEPTVAAPPPAPCDTPAIHAVATVGMVADIVQNVGGACVEVIQLMGPGVDPHLYRASEGDVLTLIAADVVFYSGIHLEARLADVFEEMNAYIPTVPVAEAIPEDLRIEDPNFGQFDPHIWMDVSLWAYTADRIRDQLAEMDPSHADFYAASAVTYRAQLEALDQYAEEQINTVPEAQRVLVTAHDAFNYFGRRYGIEVFAPQGITTTSEAGVEDIRRTIALIIDRQIPAVFVESSVPPDIVEAIIAGAEAQGQSVEIGGSLFSDAMGEAGTLEGTYIGMITHNVDTIVSALRGDASTPAQDA